MTWVWPRVTVDSLEDPGERRSARAPSSRVPSLILALLLLVLMIGGSMLFGARRSRQQELGSCSAGLRHLSAGASGILHAPAVASVDPGPGLILQAFRRREHRKESVGAALAALVQIGEIDDPGVFVCPASMDVAAPAPADLSSFAFDDSDVRTSHEFSYGWTKASLDSITKHPAATLAADRTARQRHACGIVNHGDPRLILRLDGSVDLIPAMPIGQRSQILESLNLADR